MHTRRRVIGPVLLAGALLIGPAGGARAAGEDAEGAPSTPSAARSGWSPVFSVEDDGINRISGVAEARGKLFALGRLGPIQPTIWVSQDATTWSAAQVTPLTDRLSDDEDSQLSGFMLDLVDAGDRLVAVAVLGLASGSGPIATKIYTSEDGGMTWSAVEEAGSSVGLIFDLARIGDRLVGVGTGIWVSDDGGMSWTEVVGHAALGGTMHAVDARDGLIVAAGEGGDGDLTAPPAFAMVSADGITWERVVIDPDGGAHAVAIGAAGRIVVGGHHTGTDATAWVSDDAGRTWQTARPSAECCVSDLVATPTGFVAASSTVFEGALMSPDGLTWTATALDAGLEAVAWGPRFGLSGATETAVLLGPTLGSGGPGGDITFRLTLRGEVIEGDAFGLAVDAGSGMAIERQIVCGPGSETDTAPMVACRPGSYEVVVEGGDALPAGTVLSYAWTRTRADGTSTVVYRATVTVAAHAQVRTLVYDYSLGALPDTAVGRPVGLVALGLLAIAGSVLVGVAGASGAWRRRQAALRTHGGPRPRGR